MIENFSLPPLPSVKGVATLTTAPRPRGWLRAADLGLRIGTLDCGPDDAITDVAGVAVGHHTVTSAIDPSVQTGVTVVLPHPGNIFAEKVLATCHVINGFGKSTGLVQLTELGQLESPIALTNTLSVAAVTDGLLDALLAQNPGLTSVNTVVAECNDFFLNDIRARRVRREHVALALADASEGPVQQGAVGAGRGMSAFGLKGGIGTASRLAGTEPRATVGVLVLSNFCQLPDLVVAGRPVGQRLQAERAEPPASGADGSIIVVVATDAPVNERQLGRMLRRAQNGLARTGSSTAHYSGEIVIGFTTSLRIPHQAAAPTFPVPTLREESRLLDPLFQAVTEATEEAVLNSLFNAETVTGHGAARYDAFPIERLEELLWP
jgi:D-aminopeptidase